MKHIRIYEEFKFWDAIKNKVKGLFDNIDQKLADKISGKATEMNKQKNKEGKANSYKNIIDSILDDYKIDMENSKNIISIRKTLKGTFTNLYATLTSIANSSGMKTLLPSQLFSKKYIFLGKIDSKNFDSSIDSSINKYLFSLDLEDKAKELLTSNKKIDVELEVEDSEDMDSLKNTLNDYVESMLDYVLESGIKMIKNDGLSQNQNTLSKFTQQMGSKNSQSEEKLLKYITNIKEPKSLAAVRDTLIQKGVIPKEEGGNMKF